MNIPKSYEALAADLASEKIISKTLIGQKEAYMMLADKGRLDLSESKAREDALREEIAALRESYEAMRDRKNSIVYLQQRLTVAERRVDLLEGLLKSGSSPTYAHCSAVMEALKPAAEPDHICEGCGSKGWTDNCAQCVPY